MMMASSSSSSDTGNNRPHENLIRIIFCGSIVAVLFPLSMVLFGNFDPAARENRLVRRGDFHLPFLSEDDAFSDGGGGGGGNGDDNNYKTSSSGEGDGGGFSIPPTVFFILLAIQCGCQPVITKLFMPTTIVRSTAVLGQEGIKFVISMAYLASSGGGLSAIASDWTLEAAFVAAGVPSGLYVIQNYLNVMATQALPPVTFIVLNQMKTLSTAVCCFLLVGQRQSPMQILALIILIVATLVIQKIVPLRPCQNNNNNNNNDNGDGTTTKGENTKTTDTKDEKEPLQKDEISSKEEAAEKAAETDAKNEATRLLMWGVLPALGASTLSGLAGTLAQKTLQESGRSPHLFNSELAVFSASYLMGSMALGSPDYQKMKAGGVSQGWTWKTWIPILTNAMGGILVGLVTKYQGAVVKGFAMIFGMAISGVLQQTLFAKSGGGVTLEQIVGGCLGAFSLWMHISFQPAKS